MLNILKNLFSQNDNTALTEAVKNDAFLVDVRSSAEFSETHHLASVLRYVMFVPSAPARFLLRLARERVLFSLPF